MVKVRQANKRYGDVLTIGGVPNLYCYFKESQCCFFLSATETETTRMWLRLWLPFDAPRRLVIGGPYAWLRTPMVTGTIGQGLGIGLMTGSIVVIVFFVIFALLWNTFVRPTEEDQMQQGAFRLPRKKLQATLGESSQRIGQRHEIVNQACVSRGVAGSHRVASHSSAISGRSSRARSRSRAP